MNSQPPGQQPRRQSAALQRAAQEVQHPRARNKTPPPEKSRNPSSGHGKKYKKQAVVGADDDGQQAPSEPWSPADQFGLSRPTTADSTVSAATAPVPAPGGEALVGSAPSAGDALRPRAPTPATEAASALAAANPFGPATAAAAAAAPAFFAPAAPGANTFAPEARAAKELAALVDDEAKKDAEVLRHPVMKTLISEWGDDNFDIEGEGEALDMAPLSLKASKTATRRAWNVALPLLEYAAPSEPVPDWAKPPEVVVTEAPRARRSAGAALATARTPSLLDAAFLLGDVGDDDDEEKADEADLASLARDATAALRKSETGVEAARIVKSGAGLFHNSHRSPLSTLEAALPDSVKSEAGRQGVAVKAEQRASEASRLEKARLARYGDGLDYNVRCPAELRGSRCVGKNKKKGRCPYRFHAPKTFEGGKFGADPRYMRKIEFAEGEDEYEDWDQAAWDAFICKPCAP